MAKAVLEEVGIAVAVAVAMGAVTAGAEPFDGEILRTTPGLRRFQFTPGFMARNWETFKCSWWEIVQSFSPCLTL
jgi:hypothetical protein